MDQQKQIKPESESEEEEEEEEVYPTLTSPVKTRSGQVLEFKYCKKDKRYYLPDDFSLPESIFEKLFDHQKEGIQWMYNLWRESKGGILGDDMGLGKTV